MRISENEVTNQIFHYLKAKGIFAWRNNNTPTFDPTRKLFRSMPAFSLKGVPDILGVLPDGRFLAIEVKKPYVKGVQAKGKVSDEQLAFIARANSLGAVAFVAYSVDDVMLALEGNTNQ